MRKRQISTGNTSRGEIRTKGKSKPTKISQPWHNSEKIQEIKNDFKEAKNTFA